MSRGFTLVEVLIVIAVMAILYSITAASVSGMQNEARISRAKGDLKTLELAMDGYLKNKGACPSTENYQAALLDAVPRILDGNLFDPFGAAVNKLYPCIVSGNRQYYVVYSVGLERNGNAKVSDNGSVSTEGAAIYETNGCLDLTK